MPRAAPYDRNTALDAAMSLFWEKGFHATSLKDLEAALAMRPGSIYAAFDNKEALYLLALKRYSERSQQSFRDMVEQATSPLDALADHFRAYARMAPGDMNRKACMLTKAMVDTLTTEPEIADATRAYLTAMLDGFTTAFGKARTCGELPETADPERLARRFQANITGLRLALHQGMGADEFAQLAEDMAQEIDQLRV